MGNNYNYYYNYYIDSKKRRMFLVILFIIIFLFLFQSPLKNALADYSDEFLGDEDDCDSK